MMTQHSSLTADRWARFSRDQQVLMISNEMNRASRLLADCDRESRRLAYERVLRLVDLTVEVSQSRALRRELLRWRGLIGELYIAEAADSSSHFAALRVILQLTPGSAAQIPYVLSPG
jgi:hypothetical protein